MMDPDVKMYVNLTLSAAAAGAVSAATVAATTSDLRPIIAAAVTGIGTAVVQHLRQLPRKEWTAEERVAKMNSAEAKP